MDEFQTLLLGLIAGGTILLGLPLGRLRAPRPSLRQFLNALAIGILLFLFWDVLARGWAPVDGALAAFHEGKGAWPTAVGYGALFLGGTVAGLMSLGYYERWLRGRGRPQAFGPGAMSPGEISAGRRGVSTWSPGRQLALLIAVGIGLHNFGEGLAIGASAAVGAIGLATVLVIGFALHNATEGFGIVAPLAAEGERPSWTFLLGMGAIGGVPTLVGTAIGRQFTNPALTVTFMTLAAGSILYVVIQLLAVALKTGRKENLYWGVLVGLAAGFATDMVVTAGGA